MQNTCLTEEEKINFSFSLTKQMSAASHVSFAYLRMGFKTEPLYLVPKEFAYFTVYKLI